MAPDLCSICGVVSASTCLWAMSDTLKATYLTCVYHVHAISFARFAEAHAKCMSKMGNIEVEMEALTEDVIEIVGPFINQ